MNGVVRPVARVLVVGGVWMAMLLAGGGAVNAAVEESIEMTETSLELPASKASRSTVDQACASSMTKADPEVTTAEASDYCQVITEFAVSPSEEIVLPTGTVWYRLWSQYKSNPGWQEKHSGKFYYDGTRVWSTTEYRGLKGYHNCHQGYGYWITIEVTKCTVYNGASTYQIQMWDYYKAHAFFRGFPISNARDMHINAYPSGNTYMYWND